MPLRRFLLSRRERLGRRHVATRLLFLLSRRVFRLGMGLMAPPYKRAIKNPLLTG